MRLLITLAIMSIVQTGSPAPNAPTATIANAHLKATVYLPHATDGYYRGTRFDWSGAVSSLTWKDHEYFGQWFEKYDPKLHDAIPGPVEEFLSGDEKNGYDSIGYNAAAPGGTFVRIGVGVLRKAEQKPLNRFGYYEIVDGGKWTTNPGKDRLEFIHELDDKAGHAYRYRKVLRLDGETLVIEHELKNTGTKPLATQVYNHNFFTIDQKTTGPDFVVRFPFAPKADRDLKGLAAINGRELTPLREFTRGETTFAELSGFGATASDHGFEMENRATGAGVRVTGDRPLTKLLFWSAVKTICPEPYIDASVEPGRSSTWRTTYAFYEAKTSGKRP